jgi:hypothetical protein
MFVFVKRMTPWWEAAWGGGIIGCVFFFFLFGSLRARQQVGILGVAAMLPYIVGSYVGTASDHSRHVCRHAPKIRAASIPKAYSDTAGISTILATCFCSADVLC